MAAGKPLQSGKHRTKQFAKLLLARHPQRLLLPEGVQRPLGRSVETDDRSPRIVVHLDRHVRQDKYLVVHVPVRHDEAVTACWCPGQAGFTQLAGDFDGEHPTILARRPVRGPRRLCEGRHEPQTRIGISGWTYPPWRRVFYPDWLPQRRELEFASRQVGSIEVNGSFYALQRPESFRSWAEQTPDRFVFSVKCGRFITHLKKLRDVDTALANFFASGVLALGSKLGPLLWQLPPNLGYDAERMEAFLPALPSTTAAAAELAAQHDGRVEGRAFVTTDADRPVRHALEVRHASYETPSFLALLRAQGVAVVTADTAGKWPLIEDQTADFSYLRLRLTMRRRTRIKDQPAHLTNLTLKDGRDNRLGP